MKYYLRQKDGNFIRWNDKIIYFNCWLDAIEFEEAMAAIPFLDYGKVEIYPSKEQLFLPIDTIDHTGLIPVANGDSIELREWQE